MSDYRLTPTQAVLEERIVFWSVVTFTGVAGIILNSLRYKNRNK